MKRLWLILAVVMIFSLSGCGSDGDNYFPYVMYYETAWKSYKDRLIEIPDGYILNQGNAFEWSETDCGCDLIIHFEKEVSE